MHFRLPIAVVVLLVAGAAFAIDPDAVEKKPKELSVDLGGGVKLEFVLIPAGEFMMGSPKSEGISDERPQHRVRISKPFYMGIYEVTQAEYQKVMRKNPSWFSSTGRGKERVSGVDTSRFPVERVSWNDAVEFCRKLSVLPAEKAAGRSYRLPTEAEWEYACRAGTTTPFHFGDSLNGKEANCDGTNPYGTGTKGSYLQRTTTVGCYRPNAFGLYDMHGNVGEWCQDRYSKEYYANSPLADPRGFAAGFARVLRGGSWSGSAFVCRSASRYRNSPDDPRYFIGFRVAKTVSP